MIQVQAFSLYGPLAASTRYRLGQYVPGLADMGISVRINSLLGDAYLRRKFEGARTPVLSVLKDGTRRLLDLTQLKGTGLAILYCELFPMFPAWLEHLLLRIPYIYDMDDAFYLRYQEGRMSFARGLLGGKFDRIVAGAAEVTAGNRVLVEYARKHNPSVTHLPTVVDSTRYVPAARRPTRPFTVGWIGSPSTASYLPALVEPLARLGSEAPLHFVVIGGKAPSIPNIQVTEVEWEEHTEVDLINAFDVGVMPLRDDAWARGKCAFKLIQYMACGLPVVASPVGANLDVVTHDCGFLAGSSEEWSAALRELRDNPAQRRRFGDAGRQRVLELYSLQRMLPRMAETIHRAAGS